MQKHAAVVFEAIGQPLNIAGHYASEPGWAEIYCHLVDVKRLVSRMMHEDDK